MNETSKKNPKNDEPLSSEQLESESDSNSIQIVGARVHNLKNIDVEIPRNQITVLAGPSGSGKSSLAFDTIFTEGQRQYIESLSVYARQYLKRLARPEIDYVRGLQPTVALEQRTLVNDPRGSVASVSEIYDFLRLLYARVGVARCYRCGRPIRRLSIEQIQQAIFQLPSGARFMILAPIVREKRGDHKDVFSRLVKSGSTRARVDGVIVEISNPPELDPKKFHTIETVVDRLVLREGVQSRLMESLKIAVKEGDGGICCLYEKERQKTEQGTTRSVWKEAFYSVRFSCPKCGATYSELEPNSFNFNSPQGACPACQGLGKVEAFDPELVLPKSENLLFESLASLAKGLSVVAQRKLTSLANEFEKEAPGAANLKIADWNDSTRKLFLYGAESSDVDSLEDESPKNGAESETPSSDSSKSFASFSGLLPTLEIIYKDSKSAREQAFLTQLRGKATCGECDGSKIKLEARTVEVGGKRICEALALTVADALPWFESLKFDEPEQTIAQPILEKIIERLRLMNRLRLDYLTLDRPAETLSGGEFQRLRLATILGNGLSGVCYILDEPSIGLHPQDVDRLIEVAKELRDAGNTTIFVEHNEEIMRSADWLIDLGPNAGKDGGRILAQGTPAQIEQNPDSPTGSYLRGKAGVATPCKRRKFVKTRVLTLEGVQTNNLKDVDVSFPLGLLTCVTGVSGSGKSSLINDTLAPAIIKRLSGSISTEDAEIERQMKYKSLRGASRIDKIIKVDQRPIGRSSRSNPATYAGLFDEIRKLFAETREARNRGYKAGRFSFNVAGGRCEECLGLGVQKIESMFLPDLYAPCPACEGTRYDRQTLEVRYKNKSIAEVLDMTFDEAAVFFENHVAISKIIEAFCQVGLGYLTLGQSSRSLSGGENQRVKLATELARSGAGSTLYILDEPTSGLNARDVDRLLKILFSFVDAGNTVIVVEHSLDVMRAADWIVDLGPGGGKEGGNLLATGTPEEIAALEGNATGRFLRQALERNADAQAF